MATKTSKWFPPQAGAVTPVEFARNKYGPEILVDCAWVREMPTLVRPYPHALKFYDVLLVTRGRGWHWLDGRRDAVRPGRVLFASPGEVRDWKVQGLDGLNFFFPSLFLDEFFNDALFLHRLPYFHVARGAKVLKLTRAQARELHRRLLAMRRELRNLKEDSTHLLRAQLYEVLITLARQYAAAHGPKSIPAPNQTALRYRDMVEREAAQRHDVGSYARQLGVSPNHLNAICKRHLRRSAKAVVQERLAVEARRRLLYSDESAERVGYALGFHEPSYFTRFFRRMNGCTPKEFRRVKRV